MDRRAFIGTVAGGLLAAPLAAEAQQAGKVPSVGYVTSSGRTVNVDSFDQGLRDLGYRIGQDIIVEYRFAEGRIDRLPALVDELLRLKVDVFYAPSPQALRAVSQATDTVPIVAVDLETDPVEAGWIKNSARPVGNVTGFFLDLPELSGKLIQILTEAVPRLQRVAVLWDASVAASQVKGNRRRGSGSEAQAPVTPLSSAGGLCRELRGSAQSTSPGLGAFVGALGVPEPDSSRRSCAPIPLAGHLCLSAVR